MRTVGYLKAPPVRAAALAVALYFSTVVPALAQQPAGALDLAYVPSEAVAAVVAHPRQVFTGEGADWLPLEIITAAGIKGAGFDPVQIEEVLAVFAPPAAKPDPDFGMIVRFAQAFSKDAVLAKIPKHKELEESGHKFIQEVQSGPDAVCFYLPDDRTIIIGTESMMRHMISAKNVDSPLTRLLKKTDCSGQLTAALAVEPVREMLNGALAASPDLPAPLDQYKDLPNRLDSVVIRAHVWMNFSAELTLGARDAAGAEGLQQWLQQSLAAGRQMLLAKIPPATDPQDTVAQAQRQYIERFTQQLIDSFKPVRKGADLNVSMEGAAGIAPLAAMSFVMGPAIEAAQRRADQNKRQGQ